MPPASNDNQGLKIAVVVFVTLSVVLAVATYFGFSNASFYNEKMNQAVQDASQAKQAQGELQRAFEELKREAGYEKTDDSAVLDQIAKDRTKLNEDVNKLRLKVEEVVNGYKGAAGAAGNPQVDQFADSARTAAESLTNEPKRTLTSTIDRMLDLLGNQSQLLTAVSLDYQSVRKELESVNQIAQKKIEVEINAKQQSEQEKLAELTKHEEDRRGQLKRLDDLQTQNQQYLTEINELKNQVEQLKDEWQKRYGDLLTQFRDIREQLELNENVLERADGKVTYVDYNRNEVRTTLNRRMGAREQLVFTIFDRDAAGLPTDKPKATIELIKVGEKESIGKIVKQMRNYEPVRIGDQVYSPAFGERPQTFALIGKIDVNRDGVDDREDLKRMIRSAGGEVSYDLPPPGVGAESGKLSPLTSWYVIDNRPTIRSGVEQNYGATASETQAFQTKQTAAIKEAKLEGIRPISIERLLDYVGYTFGQPTVGRREGIDMQALEQLTNPEGKVKNTVPVPTPGEEGMDENEPEPEPSGFGVFGQP
ncbi:MAG TPA: hypothetical protein VFT74_15410 [Isosphaeraceae bacterium]|nr:hypothetical protein [Isosphaeraceae bacterium]